MRVPMTVIRSSTELSGCISAASAAITRVGMAMARAVNELAATSRRRRGNLPTLFGIITPREKAPPVLIRRGSCNFKALRNLDDRDGDPIVAAVIEVGHTNLGAAVVPFGRALIAGVAIVIGPGARQFRAGLAR